MIIYVILKNGGNENSPYSLNVMVNYHYHSDKQGNYLVIPIYALAKGFSCPWLNMSVGTSFFVFHRPNEKNIRINSKNSEFMDYIWDFVDYKIIGRFSFGLCSFLFFLFILKVNLR